jgi:ferredoxin, 2Fe-2S
VSGSQLVSAGDRRQESTTEVTVVYTSQHGEQVTIDGAEGASVMETAVRNGVDGIVGECGGSLSCATCHVFVAPETEPHLAPMSDLEDDMLYGTAVDRQPNSRLSCQIKLAAGGIYHVTTPEAQL